jgi:hypothetical protein
MGTVAKRLIFGVAAAAQTDHGSPGKSKLLAVGVLNRELAFQADGSVIEDRNFRWHYPDASRSTVGYDGSVRGFSVAVLGGDRADQTVQVIFDALHSRVAGIDDPDQGVFDALDVVINTFEPPFGQVDELGDRASELNQGLGLRSVRLYNARKTIFDAVESFLAGHTSVYPVPTMAFPYN